MTERSPATGPFLPEDAVWPAGDYQWQTDDVILGGPDGIDNWPIQALANRTAYLKQQLEAGAGAIATHEASNNHPLATTGAKGMVVLATVAEAIAGALNNKVVTPEGLKAAVQEAVTALVNSAPATIDTLGEIATALGNDPNLATTLTNLIALKAPLASPAFTGIPTVPTAAPGTNTPQAASTAFVAAAIGAIGPQADTVARDQVALTNLRQVLNTAVSTGALVQGRQWELSTDEWGGTSTNETYNSASPGYYNNPGFTTTLSDVSQWTGSASITYAGDDLTFNAQWANLKSNATFAGDFTVSWRFAAAPNNAVGGDAYVGVYPVTSDATFAPAGNTAGLMSMAASWWATVDVVTSCRIGYGTTIDVTGAKATTAASVYALSRVGSTIILKIDGTVVYTWPQTSAAELRLAVGGLTTAQIADLSWTAPSASLNMTITPPAAVILSSAPAYGNAYFLWKDESGSAVLGTDLTVDLSRDGGMTWVAATLTSFGSVEGAYSVIKARAGFAAHPVGTSLTCRIKTLNNKAQRIAAPALYAE